MPRTEISAHFDAARWGRLHPGSAVQSACWIDIMLSRLPGKPLMVLHEDDDGATLGFVGAVVTEPGAYEAYNPWTILRADPEVFPAAHAGGPVAPQLGGAAQDMLPSVVLSAPGYLGDPVGPAGRRPDAVRDCLSAVLDHARDAGLATVCVLYSTPEGAAVLDPVTTALGGACFDLTSRSVLEIGWADWDDYHSGPRNRRRAEILRQLRRLAEAGGEVVREDPRPRFDEVVAARCCLLRHYGQPADEDSERRRLHALIEAFGDDLVLYSVVREGRLLAHALFVAQDRVLQNIYAGTTEEGRATPYAHLAATYYAPLMYVTGKEFDRIDYGVGHETTKRLRGCLVVPLRGHLLPVGGR
ncbi:hypothetical protein [Streptomyces chrestomyceticus]|uniref:GNAT family N-acetyltransferase n=1 Tax=Streptomyces chrestomyceticus TaxID=68185 RepID=A0ABU7WS63_9ACTN